MSHRFKGLALSLLSCLLAWTGWAGSSQAASSSEPSPDPKVEWSATYGASSNGRSVIPAADGGYIAVGEINAGDQEGYVVKVNEDGGVVWEQRLQIAGDYTKEGVTAYQIIRTQDEGYLVSGATTDTTERPRSIPYLAKLDSRGHVEWSQAYDNLSLGTHFYGESAAETPDGGFVVTGYSVNSYGEAPAYLLKVDGEGKELWLKTFRFDDNQYFNEVITAHDGGILAVGRIDSVMHSNSDASVMVKLNSLGEVEWEKRQTAPQTGRAAYSAQLSEDGGYIVSGMLRLNGLQTAYVLKTDANGETVWEKTYPLGDTSSHYGQLAITEDGYALLGRSARGEYPEQKYLYRILRIDLDGELAGTLQYEAPGLVAVGKGTPAAEGGFLLSGQVKEAGNYRMQLVKLSGAGQEFPGDPELAELRFADPAIKLEIGERKPSVLEAVYSDGTAADVTSFAAFTSLNPEIAAVDEEGVVTGLSLGTAEIIGEYGGLRGVLPVTVTGAPGEPGEPGEPQPTPGQFYLDSEDYSVTVGSELDIVALFTDETGETANVSGETRFTTARPEIAQIDEHGNITGISPGLTSVTAVYKGHTYTSSLLVVKPYVPPGMTEEPSTMEEPGIDDPGSSEESGVTEEPGVTVEPATTEAPRIDEPETSGESGVTEEPGMAEETGMKGKSGITDESSKTDNPGPTEEDRLEAEAAAEQSQ